MPEGWKFKPPKNDDGYFEQMSRAIFQAGLNWEMIQNKWPDFNKAFGGFSISKVARFDDKNVKTLMRNERIVRNEKKIRAATFNAQGFLKLKKEFGSFRNYLDSFKYDEERMIADLRSRFQHLGPSLARIFLYMVGVKLTPTHEEMQWHARHVKKQ